MSRKVTIVVDSTCDIKVDEANKLGLIYMPVLIDINGELYRDGYEITVKQFYDKLSDKSIFPKTSLVSPIDFEKVFREELAKGREVICCTISSTLSGTYNSAVLAKNIVESDKIHIVDSKTVALGFELLVREAANLANKGATASEILEFVDKLKEKQRLFVYVETLEMLKRGGRIPKSLATIGGMLQIKPILTMRDGLLETLNKTRGKKAGFKYISQLLCEKTIDKEYSFIIAHANNPIGAEELRKEIENEITNVNVIISEIGPAVGTHVGEGAVAIAFIEK